MWCDPFESIEPYRLTAVTAATGCRFTSGPLESAWFVAFDNKHRHATWFVRESVSVNEGRTLTVSEQQHRGWETDRERGMEMKRDRQRQNRDRRMEKSRFLFNSKYVIYNFIACFQRLSKGKEFPAVVEELKFKTASTTPWASCDGFSSSQRIHMACVHWPGFSCSPACLAQIQLLLCL